jgi:hypothetical protein
VGSTPVLTLAISSHTHGEERGASDATQREQVLYDLRTHEWRVASVGKATALRLSFPSLLGVRELSCQPGSASTWIS